MNVTEIVRRTQAKLKQLGANIDVDGDDGIATWTAIAKQLGVDLSPAGGRPSQPPKSAGSSIAQSLNGSMIPQKAIDLILESEGVDQPWKWPGGDSGITIGFGYDLGFTKEFARDWDGYLSAAHIERLKAALGKTGQRAAAIASQFRGIKIDRTDALNVFMSKTLPKYEGQTRAAFPGSEKLPPLAFGALVSLVFNRGAGMAGARRTEMRSIRNAIENHAAGRMELKDCLLEIASQFRLMKRLWRGKGLDGLLVRRENEAKMVEGAAS